MGKIGILAYGSLINDPGDEMRVATVSCIKDVVTPFKVEFARSSSTRHDAPTLVPVTEGGANVKAVVFVLKDSVSQDEATNILWRRETRKIGSGKTYSPLATPTSNNVVIEQLPNFAGLDTILYTRVATNIEPLTSEELAKRAIRSAKSESGKNCMDGINYLISAKKAGIVTSLMLDYEKEILRQTNAESLEDAHKVCVNQQTSNSHSTRHLDSMAFMVVWLLWLGCCSLGASEFQR